MKGILTMIRKKPKTVEEIKSTLPIFPKDIIKGIKVKIS